MVLVVVEFYGGLIVVTMMGWRALKKPKRLFESFAQVVKSGKPTPQLMHSTCGSLFTPST